MNTECQTWRCERCGFSSPYWLGCERFPLCTSCDANQRKANRIAQANQEAGDPHDRDSGVPAGYALLGRPFAIKQTPRAILFSLPTGSVWIPKSAIAQHPQGILIKSWVVRQIDRHESSFKENRFYATV
jgi:hypothetical protein